MLDDRKENASKEWEKIKISNLTIGDSTKSVTQLSIFPELAKKKEKKQGF